jgi:hypothetical protein
MADRLALRAARPRVINHYAGLDVSLICVIGGSRTTHWHSRHWRGSTHGEKSDERAHTPTHAERRLHAPLDRSLALDAFACECKFRPNIAEMVSWCDEFLTQRTELMEEAREALNWVAAVRGWRNDHVAHLDTGELTAQRRCRPSDAHAAREQREPERRA